MSESELPDRLVIRGGAVNTRFRGNGLLFDHDAMAEMAEQMEKGKFIRNHDRDVRALAGLITDVEVSREKVPKSKIGETSDHEHNDDDEVVETTHLLYEAELTSEFPAYEEVARSITVQERNGLTPHVSIAFFASGVELSDDEVVLVGPFRFAHLGLVDDGAQTPKQGVGVFEVEMSASNDHFTQYTTLENGTMLVDSPQTSVLIMNMADLSADFEQKHGISPQQAIELAEKHGMTPREVLEVPNFTRCGGENRPSEADFSPSEAENRAESAFERLKKRFQNLFEAEKEAEKSLEEIGLTPPKRHENGQKTGKMAQNGAENDDSSTQTKEIEANMDSASDDTIVEEDGKKILELNGGEDNPTLTASVDSNVDSSSNSDINIPSSVWSTSVSASYDEASAKTFDSNDNTSAFTVWSDEKSDSNGSSPNTMDIIASDSLNNDDVEQKAVPNPTKDGAEMTDKEPTPSGAGKTDAELEQELDNELEELEEAEVEELSGEQETLELPSEFEALKREHEELKAALGAILEERRAKEQTELEELRERLTLEFGVDETTIENFETKEQLEALASALRSSRSNRVPDVDVYNKRDTNAEEAELKEKERKEWHQAQYIGE